MKSPIVYKTAKDSMDHFNNTAVDIERVSVHYRIRRDRPTSLKEYAIRWVQRGLDIEYVKAINDVSLQIRKGKVFAIIGRNGAGKTTLLRVISGIIRPKQGRVRVWGKWSRCWVLALDSISSLLVEKMRFYTLPYLGVPKQGLKSCIHV